MEQAIQDCGGEDGVMEDLAPIEEALVRGDNHAGMFVSSSYQAEKETGFGVGQRQVANFIHDTAPAVGAGVNSLG